MARYLDSPLSADDLRQILELVENSKFESIDLQIGDLRLSASMTGALPASAPIDRAFAPAPSPAPASSPAPAAASSPAAPTPASNTQPGHKASGPADSDLVEITAPIVGIFYTAPEPGVPPFVEIGTEVGPDTNVGLIEVMKVFNGIKSGVAGTIVERLVEDSGFVEFGQPLFLVRPKAS
ncbi:acetyl-CoA carboxylase biotin carboxyl carrier protein subunit [Georhizobium profundi]|jgi:acetyl-CoA carboxylase biotin carboxyl carrier protein|uniref:Biotin carboxyl carrier protein of acetyl-CoA carboxylase n=1 Tax=Georhizobium profundi TaxID=2341112 RepID=A0A3S9B8T3_9HYPH|nr:biotin/lipoyl-containing protein [Georhizobium profundi]AZN73317.1 acetyl-CoA carboxylase biotin carboxyl carrier protein subunit [Georhizobium profundi]